MVLLPSSCNAFGVRKVYQRTEGKSHSATVTWLLTLGFLPWGVLYLESLSISFILQGSLPHGKRGAGASWFARARLSPLHTGPFSVRQSL